MSKQFVKDLKIGSPVQDQFVVVSVKKLFFSTPSRAGEHFLKLSLGDISGTINGVIWDRSMVTEPILPDDVLYISGEVGDYHGPQININCFNKVEKGKVNRHYLQPSCQRDSSEMWFALLQQTGSAVQDRHLSTLLNAVYSDVDLVNKFKLAPAAKMIHHSYLGGLLEHTLEVVEICSKLISMYPGKLDPSLLITGAVLHDLGKVEEYDLHSFTFQQTDRGRLLGHITIGLEMVREKIKGISSFPDKLKMNLEHMLISHHGEKEWGSPEIPLTINAFALFHADLISARMKQFIQIAEKNDPASSWTEWDRFLGRRIFTDQSG